MSRFSDNKRSGYVTLLAVTFAFGLATLGTALAVSARSYLSSAASRERSILDRISLESAAAQALSDIAAKGERPLQAVQLQVVRINGRSIATELSIPETKADLAMDDEATIMKALTGLWKGAEVPEPTHPRALEAWSRSLGLSANAEDCARRWVTLGRAPEPLSATLLEEGAPLVGMLAVGDQVDLRLRLDAGPTARVLWIRTRFGGKNWHIHDYRILTGIRPDLCNSNSRKSLLYGAGLRDCSQ